MLTDQEARKLRAMRPSEHWDMSHWDITMKAIKYYETLVRIGSIDATWPKDTAYNIHDDCEKAKKIIGTIQKMVAEGKR